MTRDELQLMAEGIVLLRDEIMRRRPEDVGRVDLTAPQARALRTIVRTEPIRMGELADQLGVTDATASRTATALESHGLVARTQDPSDARAVRVVATASGRSEQQRRRQTFLRALERLLADLPEGERTQLSASLETLGSLLAPAQVPRRRNRMKSVS
jgi:DNA-binding MarR family transcriptional regulator